MKKLLFAVLCIFALCAMSVAADDDDRNAFHATLKGINETPGPVATAATGSFDGTLSADGTTLTYTVTYKNLNAPITQSHIHYGLSKETGGVMVFFCANAPIVPPAGTPVCPNDATNSGTVSGTITVANLIGPNGQGITPGVDFDKFLNALRTGASYANVHTTRSPGGEIRGVVRRGDGDRDDRRRGHDRDHDGDHDHDHHR